MLPLRGCALPQGKLGLTGDSRFQDMMLRCVNFLRMASPIIAVLAVFRAMPAFAIPTLRVVTNINDSGDGSLRQAIADAGASNTGDTIVFQSGLVGIIRLTRFLAIENALTISGPGASAVVISGEGRTNVLFVDLLATVSISGVAIVQGDGSGGGITNRGTLTLSDSIISNNQTLKEVDGGAIVNAGTLTVLNSSIVDNGNSGNDTGGVVNKTSGALTLVGTTVSGNQGKVTGGIFNQGVLTADNCTIFGNSGGLGGGINNTGMLRLTNCTVAGNSASASTGGGGGILNPGFAIIKNTILANNPTGGNCDSVGRLPTSDGHNLSDDITCRDAFNAPPDLNDTPAGLDSGLKNNGGDNQTIALLPESAAVDAIPTEDCTELDDATPIATDQRGTARPQGTGCDIGAFELVPEPVVGKLNFSSSKLNFGAVSVNHAKIKKLRISNAGKITKTSQPLPIVIETETAGGTPTPSPFSVTTQCAHLALKPAGKGVPKNETLCDVSIQFEPTQAVSYAGILTVADNLAPSGQQTIQLTGKGKASK